MKVFISISAVPLSLTRSYVKGFNKQHYASVFNKYGSGKGKDKFRIYVPINASGLKAGVVEAPDVVTEALKSKGYEIEDYAVGLAVDSTGKRRMRIGRLLKDDPVASKVYQNDPGRSGTKSVPAWVVISRHPYDIIGSSFDRGWTSCMNLKDGSRKQYLKADVRAGSLVAYLITESDKNINNPIARIMIRPYAYQRYKGSQLVIKKLLVPGPTYGTVNESFTKIVRMFCTYMNHGVPAGKYVCPPNLYDDSEVEYILHNNKPHNLDKLTAQDLRNLVQSPLTSEDVFEKLATHKHRSQQVLEAMGDSAYTPTKVLSSLLEDPEVPPEAISKILENTNTPVKSLREFVLSTKNADFLSAAAKNTSIDLATQKKIAGSSSKNAKIRLAKNTSLASVVATTLSHDRSLDVVCAVASHSSLPQDDVNRLIEGGKISVLERVATRDDLTDTQVETLMGTPGSLGVEVRAKLASNTHLKSDIYIQLASSASPTIRAKLADNKSTPVSVLEQLADDPSYLVRENVASSPNATASILERMASVIDVNNGKSFNLVTNIADNKAAPDQLLINMWASCKYNTELKQELASCIRVRDYELVEGVWQKVSDED